MLEVADPEIRVHPAARTGERCLRRVTTACASSSRTTPRTWRSSASRPTRSSMRETVVVVIGTLLVRGRGSGIEMTFPTATVTTVRDGKIVHFEEFIERDKALAAAGCSRDLAAPRTFTGLTSEGGPYRQGFVTVSAAAHVEADMPDGRRGRRARPPCAARGGRRLGRGRGPALARLAARPRVLHLGRRARGARLPDLEAADAAARPAPDAPASWSRCISPTLTSGRRRAGCTGRRPHPAHR